MQILLNTDPHIDGREAMREHLEAVVTEVLGPFGKRITCVQACLTDASRARPLDIHCTLNVELLGRQPVLVSHHAGTTNLALHGALRKLGCVLAHEFASEFAHEIKVQDRYARPAHRPQPPAGQSRLVAAQMSA